MITLLFPSVGRRVELIETFYQAAQMLDTTIKIIATDISETAPAIHFTDCFAIVPRITDPGYIDAMVALCEAHAVTMIIPTIDTELELLSANREKFLEIGTKVLVSDDQFTAICSDKTKTHRFFGELELKTPYLYGAHEEVTQYPCFIKPLNGSSSINTYKVNNPTELTFFKSYIPDYMVQEFIEGTEYTIDVFCDFEGNPIFITPRIRVITRAGEVNRTKIVKDDLMIEEVRQMLLKVKPIGPITVQCIKDRVTGVNNYLEINARFGGGAPLSIAAGANSSKALLSLLLGKPVEEPLFSATDGLFFSRYEQSIALIEKNGHYEKI